MLDGESDFRSTLSAGALQHIDKQHRRLFDIANHVMTEIARGDGHEAVGDVVETLIAYPMPAMTPLERRCRRWDNGCPKPEKIRIAVPNLSQ